jgi:hypothetical protein
MWGVAAICSDSGIEGLRMVGKPRGRSIVDGAASGMVSNMVESPSREVGSCNQINDEALQFRHEFQDTSQFAMRHQSKSQDE